MVCKTAYAACFQPTGRTPPGPAHVLTCSCAVAQPGAVAEQVLPGRSPRLLHEDHAPRPGEVSEELPQLTVHPCCVDGVGKWSGMLASASQPVLERLVC